MYQYTEKLTSKNNRSDIRFREDILIKDIDWLHPESKGVFTPFDALDQQVINGESSIKPDQLALDNSVKGREDGKEEIIFDERITNVDLDIEQNELKPVFENNVRKKWNLGDRLNVEKSENADVEDNDDGEDEV